MLSKQPKRGAVDKEFENRKKRGMYSLLMMFVGALLAVMIGVFLYLSPFFNQKTSVPLNAPVEVSSLATSDMQSQSFEFYEVLPKQEFINIPEGISVQNHDQATNQELRIDEVVHDNTADDANTNELDTTNDTNQIVVVEENATYDDPSSVIHIQSAKPSVTYILQVRSYDNAVEADRRRAEVLMAGVDAQVVKRHDGAGGIMYQVISTPFVNRDSAMKAYQRLQSNGIDSVVVEQKHRP